MLDRIRSGRGHSIGREICGSIPSTPEVEKLDLGVSCDLSVALPCTVIAKTCAMGSSDSKLLFGKPA